MEDRNDMEGRYSRRAPSFSSKIAAFATIIDFLVDSIRSPSTRKIVKIRTESIGLTDALKSFPTTLVHSLAVGIMSAAISNVVLGGPK